MFRWKSRKLKAGKPKTEYCKPKKKRKLLGTEGEEATTACIYGICIYFA